MGGTNEDDAEREGTEDHGDAGEEGDGSGRRTPTRRELLALGAGAGLGAMATGSVRPWVDDGRISRSGEGFGLSNDLDLRGHALENVARLGMAGDVASLRTSGTGAGVLEVRDAAAGTWSMRATEGTEGTPGPVEFQAPVTGGGTGADRSPSLAVEGGAAIDGLSVGGWHVVDVSEHGVEPGTDDDLGEFVDGHFNRQVPDESVIYYLPEGTYTWNTAVRSEEFNAFGLVGRPQAEVKCTDPGMEYFLLFGSSRADVNDMFVAENVTFNIETPNVAASAIVAAVDDYIYIDNCEVVGEMDRNHGYIYTIHPTLLTNTGRGYVNVSLPDGSFYDPDLRETEHPAGIALEHDHLGYLIIENSYVEGFINNGIYSSGHNGNVAIRNTTVKNCGAGMLRLGNGDFAYKCHLVNDDAEDRGGYSYAALWVKDAETAVANSITIEAHQRTPSELIRVHEDVRSCTLANIDVQSYANQYVCRFRGDGPDAGSITATNWNVHDRASADSRVHLGVIERANTKISNWEVDIDPPATGTRRGIVVDAPWVDVTDSTFRHRRGPEQALTLDDGADYLRLKNCDFKSGTLYQFPRATVEEAIVADNRFVDGTDLHGEQVNWTVR